MFQEKIREKNDIIYPQKTKNAQDIIPVNKVYEEGVFKLSRDRYSATYELKDIDYADKKENEQRNILAKHISIGCVRKKPTFESVFTTSSIPTRIRGMAVRLNLVPMDSRNELS